MRCATKKLTIILAVKFQQTLFHNGFNRATQFDNKQIPLQHYCGTKLDRYFGYGIYIYINNIYSVGPHMQLQTTINKMWSGMMIQKCWQNQFTYFASGV